MHGYGIQRRDKKSCMYGCCGYKAHPFDSGWFRGKVAVIQVTKAARRRARQEGKAAIRVALKDLDS